MLGFINSTMNVDSTLELLEMVFEGNLKEIPEGEGIEVRYVDGDYLLAPIVSKTLNFENRIDCSDGIIRTVFWREKGALFFQVREEEEIH